MILMPQEATILSRRKWLAQQNVPEEWWVKCEVNGESDKESGQERREFQTRNGDQQGPTLLMN